MSLAVIEEKAGVYAEAVATLNETLRVMDEEIAAVRERYTKVMTEQVTHYTDARMALEGAILESPENFVKPKTLVIAGVKVGFRKSAGRVVIENEANTIALIRKKLAQKSDVLIATKEFVLKDAVKALDGKEIAAIGVTITADTDEVVIKSEASDIEKLIEAYIRESGEKPPI